ncbi:hypothetical protein AB3X91_00510 [Paraburkholderia sp. BR14263]|uniref:hypothetical protein n=1 Tax=unclassified Paraburkholderia TaxID=2615204 RepID=UPI0034CF900F
MPFVLCRFWRWGGAQWTWENRVPDKEDVVCWCAERFQRVEKALANVCFAVKSTWRSSVRNWPSLATSLQIGIRKDSKRLMPEGAIPAISTVSHACN